MRMQRMILPMTLSRFSTASTHNRLSDPKGEIVAKGGNRTLSPISGRSICVEVLPAKPPADTGLVGAEICGRTFGCQQNGRRQATVRYFAGICRTRSNRFTLNEWGQRHSL